MPNRSIRLFAMVTVQQITQPPLDSWSHLDIDAAITGASQHLTRVKGNIGTGIFAKPMVLFSREAGIADIDGSFIPRLGIDENEISIYAKSN